MELQIINRNIQDLQAHFRKIQNLPERSLFCWSRYFNDHLSEEELEKAVDLALVTYGCDYDISAKTLVELVKGSEKELVLDCWAKALDALAQRLELSQLDEASQFAITKMGGTSHLGELPITTLYKMKFDFCELWHSYRKNPQEFRQAALVWVDKQESKEEEQEYAALSEIPEIKAKWKEFCSQLEQRKPRNLNTLASTTFQGLREEAQSSSVQFNTNSAHALAQKAWAKRVLEKAPVEGDDLPF